MQINAFLGNSGSCVRNVNYSLGYCGVSGYMSIETELFMSHHVGAHVRGSGSDAFVQIKNAIYLPRNNTSIVTQL